MMAKVDLEIPYRHSAEERTTAHQYSNFNDSEQDAIRKRLLNTKKAALEEIAAKLKLDLVNATVADLVDAIILRARGIVQQSNADYRVFRESDTYKRAVLANLIEQMERESAGVLAKFAADLAVNPSYAFEWADRAFRAASQQEFAAELSGRLEGGMAVADIITWVYETLLHRIGLSGNTSTSHRAMDAARAEVRKDLIESLHWM